MALDDIISGAVAEAREGGMVGETDSEEQAADDIVVDDVDDADDESGDEGDSGDDEAAVAAKSGDEEGDEEAIADEGDEEEAEETDGDDEEAEEEAAPVNEDDKLASDLGIDPKLKGKDRWKAKVSLSKVKSYLKEHGGGSEAYATVAKVFGVDPKKISKENLESGLTKFFTDFTEMKGRAQNFDTLEPIMLSKSDADADKFMAALVAVNPKFKRFVEGKAAPAAKELPTAEEDPEPEMDVEIDIGDGKKGKTYSQAGYKKYIAWLRRDVTREVEAKTMAKIKPYEDKVAAENQTAEEREALSTRVNDLLAEANEWDGFKENEAEIQKAFNTISKAQPKLTMEKVMARAYQQVVIGGLKTSKQKVRDEVLAEGKKAPKSVAGPAAGGKKKAAAKPAADADANPGDRLTNVIREQVAQAKARGVR